LESARELRGERDVRDASGSEQALEERRVRVAARLRRVRPEPVGGDERALEVRAEDPRRPLLGGQLAERRLELGLRRGDEGRLERGHAGAGERVAGAAVVAGGGGEE